MINLNDLNAFTKEWNDFFQELNTARKAEFEQRNPDENFSPMSASEHLKFLMDKPESARNSAIDGFFQGLAMVVEGLNQFDRTALIGRCSELREKTKSLLAPAAPAAHASPVITFARDEEIKSTTEDESKRREEKKIRMDKAKKLQKRRELIASSRKKEQP